MALGGLSFRVPEGQIFSLLGPNGAGKATTRRTASGVLRSDSGADAKRSHT